MDLLIVDRRWQPILEQLRVRTAGDVMALLGGLARRFCTRGQRVRFLRKYVGRPGADEEVRKLIREVLAYRRRRWPARGGHTG